MNALGFGHHHQCEEDSPKLLLVIALVLILFPDLLGGLLGGLGDNTMLLVVAFLLISGII